MKGKSEFTIDEIKSIEYLIQEKLKASFLKQVSIRNKIRNNLKFY